MSVIDFPFDVPPPRPNRIAARLQQVEDARITAQRDAAEQSLTRAVHAAKLEGEQSGYIRGTHWGMLVGFVAGVIFAGIVIGAWTALRPQLWRLLLEWVPSLLPSTGLTV